MVLGAERVRRGLHPFAACCPTSGDLGVSQLNRGAELALVLLIEVSARLCMALLEDRGLLIDLGDE